MGLLDTYAKSATFPTKGARVAGRVVRDAAEIQQRDYDDGSPLYWGEGGKKVTVNTGEPCMQLVVTVDTGQTDPTVEDDDGLRAIYFKGRMLKALKEQTRKHRRSKVAEGDWVGVTFVEEEPPPAGKRGKPSKVYDVEFEPAAPADSIDESRSRSSEPSQRTTAQREALDRLRRDRTVAASADEEPPF
jgi:hypothetical protein